MTLELPHDITNLLHYFQSVRLPLGNHAAADTSADPARQTVFPAVSHPATSRRLPPVMPRVESSARGEKR